MGDEHLVEVMKKRYATMVPEKRMVEIRKLARQSAGQRDFLKKYFPDFYREAYPNG
jgi:hypothetical protein